MKNKLTIKASLMIAMFSVGAGQAYAAGTGAHMKTTGRTSQPIGHYEYCQQYSVDCNLRSSNVKAPQLTRQRWNELVEVNNFSNTSVIPVTDMDYYNVEELWTYPKKYGDCEDFALMKRHMLIQRGWPASSLLITVVRQRSGDGHAVLTVRTDRADYILDNLNGKVLPWNETEYRYLKRQSAKHSGHWISINDSRNLSVGSIN